MFLARGRTADVFALDEKRVLRRYRGGLDVAAEAETMAYLHGLGFPVPKVEAAAGTDLVMERVDGPTMADALISGALPIEEAARLLANLHTRLHALAPPTSQDPAARILHLDLHPENVLLSSHGPVVIDWSTAAEGPPELDVALTALILAEVAVGGPAEIAEAVAIFIPAFLAHADLDIGEALPRSAARRTANPTLSPEEVARIPRAVAFIAASASVPAVHEKN